LLASFHACDGNGAVWCGTRGGCCCRTLDLGLGSGFWVLGSALSGRIGNVADVVARS